MRVNTEIGQELRSAVRDVLKRYDRGIAPVEDGAESEALWSRLSKELGVAGLLVLERYGGLGLGAAELVEVSAELGRSLVGGPFVATAVIATTALTAIEAPTNSTRVATLLAEIAAGDANATLVHRPLGTSMPVTARAGADDIVLTGTVSPILAAPSGTLLVPADLDGTAVVALVEPGAGAQVTALRSLDITRPAWRVDLDQVPATPVATGEVAVDAVHRAEVAGWMALGAECIGVASHALDLTVEHARTRHQFGRPIGAFQAVQHQLADLTVLLEVARSAAEFAVRQADTPSWHATAATHALVAKSAEAAVTITTEAIQLHGGIGYTWEHPAHLFLRRAHADAALAGTPAQHRRALFALLDHEPRETAAAGGQR